MDTGRCPTASEGLNALAQRPDGAEVWNGLYLKGDHVLLDPRGHTYQYRAPVDHNPPYDIISLGSDGVEGGTGMRCRHLQHSALTTFAFRIAWPCRTFRAVCSGIRAFHSSCCLFADIDNVKIVGAPVFV
jgi:hypothetical protein